MARGQSEGLFPRGLVFHGLFEFKVMFLEEFLKRVREKIAKMPIEEKARLLGSKGKFLDWVEYELMRYCDDVLYLEEDCVYTLINLSESRGVNDWICLYDDDEVVIFCQKYGLFDEMVATIEEEIKKTLV